MTTILMGIGLDLKRRLHGTLVQPLSWRIIDAMVSLEEAEERHRRTRTAACTTMAGAAPHNDNAAASLRLAPPYDAPDT